MIKLINEIFWMMGLTICVMLLLGLISMLLDKIGEKIKDFKDRKTLIKKGTVFYLDGKQVILKRDLDLRFKKVKYTECVCEEYKEIPRGIERGIRTKFHRRWAKTNFETNLLNMYKEFPDKFNHIIEYINEDNIEN